MYDFVKVCLALCALAYIWDAFCKFQYELPADWVGPKKRRFRIRTLQTEWGSYHEWRDSRRKVVHRRWVWENH